MEDADDKACARCGYHVCHECRISKILTYEGKQELCPKCATEYIVKKHAEIEPQN
jgi:CO dehydrogenase/acetyl-CoA synthase gamma subunit (corrinoid Fe-S protein)